MKSSKVLRLVLIAMFALPAIVPFSTASAQSAPQGITVIGIGHATAPADSATLLFMVNTDSSDALDDAAASPEAGHTDQTGAIVDALVAEGANEGAITVDVNSFIPNYGDPSMPIPAIVRLDIDQPTAASVRALVGTVYDTARNEGIDISASAVLYRVDDCHSLDLAARQDAVDDALAQAEDQANVLDVTLGTPVATRDVPVAMTSRTAPAAVNSCDLNREFSTSELMYTSPMYDPTIPAEVVVEVGIEVTYGIDVN